LLAALLLNNNRTTTVSHLVPAIWPSPPRSVDSNLRTYIAALRAAFVEAGEPASRLSTEPAGYRLQLDPAELDLSRFTTLYQEGERARLEGEPRRALSRFEQARELWHGEPLAGLSVGPQLEAEIARLEELRLLVAERWAEAALAEARYDEVAAELVLMVKTSPFHERLRVQLMTALALAGRTAAALASYREVYHLYAKELGIVPGRPLQALHQRILRADPNLSGHSLGKALPVR
jgi:DNA-binding SARP family transcriptional activator